MSRSVKSYDVFDTLIARRSYDPRAVLAELEIRAGVPGLAQARLAADRKLGALGMPYTLRDMWQEVGRALHLSDHTVDQLYHREIRLEHEQVIPIVDNMSLVNDGDLLVSDTYLPPEEVMSLVRTAGLEKTVALITSNDGKFRGWIWPKLLDNLSIQEHFGDNVHSDGKTPSEAGIKAIIYTGTKRTSIEQFLVDQGWNSLANLIREIRLANPFSPSRPRSAILWNLSCELNFPLLFFVSLQLGQFVKQQAFSDVLFVSRDCLLWQRLFQRLFPKQRSRYFFASRKCLLKPSDNYLNYFRSTWTPSSLIVDLFSTGASLAKLFAKLDTKGNCFFIGFVDNYRYLANAPDPQERLKTTSIFRNSELGTPVNKNVEMLNYAPHPVVEDVIWLPAQGPAPVLADHLEYDRVLPEAAHQFFRTGIERLKHYPDLLRPNSISGSIGELIKALVGFICADQMTAEHLCRPPTSGRCLSETTAGITGNMVLFESVVVQPMPCSAQSQPMTKLQRRRRLGCME